MMSTAGRSISCARRVDRLGEVLKEIVGDFLGGAVDQALAELREFTADLRLDVVAEQGTAILRRQLDRGAAFGEASHAAVALPRNLVTMRRIEVRQRDLAFEFRFDRTDLDGGDGLHFGVG